MPTRLLGLCCAGRIIEPRHVGADILVLGLPKRRGAMFCRLTRQAVRPTFISRSEMATFSSRAPFGDPHRQSSARFQRPASAARAGRHMARWALFVPQDRSPRAAARPSWRDDQLRKESLAPAPIAPKSGESLDRLLPEGLRPSSRGPGRAQRLACGTSMCSLSAGGGDCTLARWPRCQTGEGKNAQPPRSCSISTPSPAKGGAPGHGERLPSPAAIAEWDGGRSTRHSALTVGVIEAPSPPSRPVAQAYACDITYGTAKEFGFDFLRDRLLLRGPGARGRSDLIGPDARRPSATGAAPGGAGAGRNFIVVDEADSLLIDEARTPLIIGGPAGAKRPRFKAACLPFGPRRPAGQFRRGIALRLQAQGKGRSS